MGGAHLINPYDIDGIAAAILHTTDTRPEEKAERMKQSFEYTSRHTTLKWAQKFLNDLKRADDQVGY